MQIHLLSQEYLALSNQLDISVVSGGYADLDTNWKSQSIRQPFTRMYFTESGEGHLQINGETHRLQKGVMYILPSGLRFSFSCPDTLKQIFFHVHVLHEGRDLLQRHREFFTYPVEDETLVRLKALLTSASPAAPAALKAMLWQFLSPAAETVLLNESSGQRVAAPMQEILNFISDNLSARLTTDAIATRFHVSRSKLQRDFKTFLGVTPKEYIHTQLFIKAEHLLLNTTCSIKEISDQLGFCDQFYFSKCFSKKYAMPPLRYKSVYLGQKDGDTSVIKHSR